MKNKKSFIAGMVTMLLLVSLVGTAYATVGTAGFYYPVVPKDQARIRVQISAGHEKEHLDKCIAAFIKEIGRAHV